MDTIHVAVLVGTVRKNRKTIYAANLIHTVGSDLPNVKTTLVDPRDLHLPNEGQVVRDPSYTKITKEADAFFIVCPEYNHGFPGSLKRMLDSELKNYIHKPVALAGVSSGALGGARVIELLVPVVRELGMIVTFEDVRFPHVKDLFDDEGTLQDETYIKRVQKSYTELVWMAQALKWGRKHLKSKHHKN